MHQGPLGFSEMFPVFWENPTGSPSENIHTKNALLKLQRVMKRIRHFLFLHVQSSRAKRMRNNPDVYLKNNTEFSSVLSALNDKCVAASVHS